MRKYPRTPHVESSRLQPADEDLSQVPFADLAHTHLVIEEKLDGANAGISFSPSGELLLQSRGHYLTGGPRERHFDVLKAWSATHHQALYRALSTRYILYGELLTAKHTEFYDALPHYFFEFDILDTQTGTFLDTPSRHALLKGTPVLSVPVLHQGTLSSLKELTSLVRPSLYKTPDFLNALREQATLLGQDVDRVVRETDPSLLSEGIYIKQEQNGVVTGRFKWVRSDFLNAIVDPQGEVTSHWLDRPHIPNLLAPGVDIYAPTLSTASTALRPGQIR